MNYRYGLALTAALVALSGCGVPEGEKDKRGSGDGPVAEARGEDSPAVVLNMPNGFSNVATKCIPGSAVRIMVTKHDNVSRELEAIIDPVCGSVAMQEAETGG